MKKVWMAAVLTAALSVGTVAFAADNTDLSTLPQVYAKDSLFTLDKEHVAGGNGTLHGKFAFARTSATQEQAIKEIGRMTLNKGESVGLHTHAVNEDAYIILDGEGIFTDSNGKELSLIHI